MNRDGEFLECKPRVYPPRKWWDGLYLWWHRLRMRRHIVPGVIEIVDDPAQRPKFAPKFEDHA